MIWLYIAVMAVALVCYRMDQVRRRRYGDDKRGVPWNWEDRE